jgi:hypothetical protein
MNALVFVPRDNAPGKKDVTRAFAPEAAAFLSLHRVPPARRIVFDNSRDYLGRAKQVLDTLARVEPGSLETLAFFCHGWRDGLQVGVHKALGTFADAVARRCVIDATIIFYACSAGRDGDNDKIDDTKPGLGDDGGFADALRDALVARGMRPKIIAHTTDGHATRNPYVRIFDASTTKSGRWLVEPKSKLWPKWVAALRGDLRFRFPFMLDEDVREELSR